VRDQDKDLVEMTIFMSEGGESFIKRRGQSLVLAPKEADVGDYKVEIFLIDRNPKPLQNYYSFNITVKSGLPPMPKVSPTLEAKIASIS